MNQFWLKINAALLDTKYIHQQQNIYTYMYIYTYIYIYIYVHVFWKKSSLTRTLAPNYTFKH